MKSYIVIKKQKMKFSLLLLCLIIVSLSTSSGQGTKILDEFWGLKIGSSLDQCEKVLKSNGGKFMKKDLMKGDLDSTFSDYQYCGGIIVGIDTCETVNIVFIEKKLETFTIIFKSDDVDTINNILYEQVRKQITEKYFEPKIDEKSYDDWLIATKVDSAFTYKTLKRRNVWANLINDKVDYMVELGLHTNGGLIEYKNKNGRGPTMVAFVCMHLNGKFVGH